MNPPWDNSGELSASMVSAHTFTWQQTSKYHETEVPHSHGEERGARQIAGGQGPSFDSCGNSHFGALSWVFIPSFLPLMCPHIWQFHGVSKHRNDHRSHSLSAQPPDSWSFTHTHYFPITCRAIYWDSLVIVVSTESRLEVHLWTKSFTSHQILRHTSDIVFLLPSYHYIKWNGQMLALRLSYEW